MKTFQYRGLDSGGRTHRGLVEALDLKEAREKLAARGVLVEKVAPAAQNKLSFLRRTELNADARAILYRETAALLRAGLPLAQALDVLIQAPETGDHRGKLAGIRDRIREGSGFAASLSEVSSKTTPFERAVIEVGERAGTLDEVLDRLAAFLEEQQKLRDKVQTALIYPCVIVCVAGLIAALMLGVMIPRVTRLLTETGIALPGITRFAMALGKGLVPIGAPVAICLIAAAVMLKRRLSRDAELRERWDCILFRLPLVGHGYRALSSLRFARTLAMLLQGGIPMVEGVELSGRATGSPWVTRLAAEAADAVRHGRSVADAVRGIHPLSGSLPGWIQAGEAGGRIDQLLLNASDRFQQQWDRLVLRSMGLLEPLLILLIGGFVLLISLAILLPVLSLNRALM